MPSAPRPIASVANGATAKPAAGTTDRTTNEQFAPGNRAAVGRGNPFSRKLGSLRSPYIRIRLNLLLASHLPEVRLLSTARGIRGRLPRGAERHDAVQWRLRLGRG
jgi:hypothetical protein